MRKLLASLTLNTTFPTYQPKRYSKIRKEGEPNSVLKVRLAQFDQSLELLLLPVAKPRFVKANWTEIKRRSKSEEFSRIVTDWEPN